MAVKLTPGAAPTVAELIAKLQQQPQDAVVLFAYDEYGRTSTFGHINPTNIALNDKGQLHYNADNELVTCDEDDMEDGVEMVDNPPAGGNYVKAVMLFTH